MRYGIFSDPHANLPALEAVLKAYEIEGIDEYLCLGDLVGYGADPQPVIEQVKTICRVIVAGNHDWAVGGRLGTDYFNRYARTAVEWTGRNISPGEKNYLNSLELEYSDKHLTCVHGTLYEPEKFNYLISSSAVLRDVPFNKKRIYFVGHTHVPAIFKVKDGKIKVCPVEHCKLEDGASYSINVGSVGQPRDGLSSAAYCIFDTKKNLVEIKRIEYNITKEENQIRKAGLPLFLADRLSQGR